MKASELQIGDWVTNRTNTINEKIDKEFLIGLLSGKYEETEVFPIPLTAEILEKNHLRENLCERYAVLGGEHSMVTMHDAFCYVHELQRALRCCGLWDLADNFQV